MIGRCLTCVVQHEAPGPVRVLGLPLVDAALPQQGGLLVTHHPQDALPCQGARHQDPEIRGGGLDLGQDGAGEVEELNERVVPVQGVDVHEHGAGGVGHICQVMTTLGLEYLVITPLSRPICPGNNCPCSKCPGVTIIRFTME